MLNTAFFTQHLFSELNRLQGDLENIFGRNVTGNSVWNTGRNYPPVSVGETESNYIVYLFAPGLEKKDIDITIQGNLLTITGERLTAISVDKENNESKKVHCYRAERPWGTFSRVITLPDSADQSNVSASYTDGVLEVSVGKRKESKPLKVEVQVN